MRFLYTTYTETFYCEEMLFKQYKSFLKTFYGNDFDVNYFLIHFIEMFSALSKKPAEFFYQLSLPELFLLLIQLRIYTLGKECQVVFVSKDKDDEQNKNLFLNLETIKNSLLDFRDFNLPCNIGLNEITITLMFPCLKNILSPSFNEKRSEYYIQTCQVENVTLENLTIEQAQEIYNKLPANLNAQLNAKKGELIDSFLQINFLESYKDLSGFRLNFQLTIENLIWYCKLLFNETVETLFDNLFYLNYIGKISTSYIEESCSPGEYLFFIKKLNSVLSEQTQKNPDEETVHHKQSLTDSML